MATTRSGPPKRPQSTTRKAATARGGSEGSPFLGINPKYHTAIFVGLIFLALIIFFSGPIFSNRIFGANDYMAWESFRPYLNMMDAKGESPLWMPYIFSGMPAYAAYMVTGDRWWDLAMKIFYSSEHVVGVVNYPVMRVVFHYFIYGLGMFLLMRSKKAARSTSFFVSMAAMFSTWIIIYIMIGHNTKITVLMTFPYIFLCLEKLIERWRLLYAGLLVLAVHIMVEAAHLQTAFYGLCAVGIYLLIEFISELTGSSEKKSRLLRVILATGTLLLAGVMAYGMGLDRNLAVNEYLPYSTRGAASITVDPKHEQSAMEVGQGYEYSTRWSFSPEEMITFVVPGYYGFGKVQYPPDASSDNEPPMLYWGQMDFTDAAHYMGIAVLILGIFGAWTNRSNRFVQGMIGVALFGLLLSFGKNSLGFVYDLFYNIVPGFNKFRAPSQSLILLEFAFPILAGFGIESLIAMHKTRENPKATKTILYGAMFFGAFTLIGLLAQTMLKSSYASSVNASQKGPAGNEAAVDFVFNMAMTDWLVSGFFGVCTLLLMYYYLKGRLSPAVFKTLLLGILIFDLWRIAYRPMHTVPLEAVEQEFAPTDVDEFLKQDTSKHRIFDLTRQPNYPARQLEEHVLGYSSAKMRSYQNLLDVAGDGDRPTSSLAQRILNTKYVIVPLQGQQPQQKYMGMTLAHISPTGRAVYRLDDALPRAWFVNRVEVVDEKTTLERIKEGQFDPRDVAYLVKPLETQVSPVGYNAGMEGKMSLDSAGNLIPDTTVTAADPGRGSVAITRYEPLHIGMDVNAPGPGNNFLVISEMHYPPGWNATIDGRAAEIIQTDYLLRGLVVPAGNHKIEMHYVSSGFETGKWTSLALNLGMFAAIVAGVMIERRRPEEADPVHNAPAIAEDDV